MSKSVKSALKLRLDEPSSAASLFFRSRLEGSSDILRDSCLLNGEVRDCKLENPRKLVCRCNMISVACGRAMAKGFESSVVPAFGGLGGGSEGLIN